MIGEVVGKYRVIGKLGAGGMGTVWLAEHELLGSRAAIKVLLPHLSKQDMIVQRFFDEARAATRIRDPGIVTVLDFGWHQGEAYLVMELLSGQTLSQRLGFGTLPPVTAVRYIQLTSLAMAAAHARGIIHRDLKPDNLFVVPDPAVPGGERIKILDFGIAKLLDRPADAAHYSTVTGMIMGTPAYMSPEQCRGAGEIDHRTDIYALGCVLFHLLCGRPPFIAATPGEMIASQLREDPHAPSTIVATISPELDALVLKCLAKQPDARFATMTELVRAAAAITGDNSAQETIAPMRAAPTFETDPTQTPEASHRATERSLLASSRGAFPARSPTTTPSTGSFSADAAPQPRSRARSGVILAILVAGVGFGSFALIDRGADRAVTSAGDAPRSIAAPPTMGFDASVVAPPTTTTTTTTTQPSTPTTPKPAPFDAAPASRPDAGVRTLHHGPGSADSYNYR
jgi:serine/threonine protein kinase